jgi:choline dehydrogenase-like flavoprotein
MTLARELSGVTDVLLIEAGGFEGSGSALLEGECAGIGYPLTETRARRFGGSSELWAGYCAVFDAHDFVRRDWVPGSGWPFGSNELAPFYQQAAAVLNLADDNFDAQDIARSCNAGLRFDGDGLAPTVWRFGTPTERFGGRWRDAFEADAKLTTLLHANLVDIRLDPGGGRIAELVIRTIDGREGRVRASYFVLACGGIETARLLLNADSQMPDGVGNSSNLVGRCFMEHPHISVPGMTFVDGAWSTTWTGRGTFGAGQEFASALGISGQAQMDARILNARAHVYRTPEMSDLETPRLGLFLEQAPNPASRITLSPARDALGLRRVRLDWQVTALDWKTYETTAALLGGAFEAAGVGRFESWRQPRTRDPSVILHSNHHLGTTRMSDTARTGVVDPDCRMHDLENCYISGGSVFPTVSWANPTMTVLALTFRLANHLRGKIAPSPRDNRQTAGKVPRDPATLRSHLATGGQPSRESLANKAN